MSDGVKMQNAYEFMQSLNRPTPRSKAGRAINDERLSNREAEQERAVRLIKKRLKEDDMTQVVAASGFGKTWVAHKLIADASRTNARYVAVVVEPGILLVDQAKKRFAEYLGDRGSQFDLVAVCSDAEAKTPWGEFNHLNITQFRALLKTGEHRRTIILTTNASASKVGEVLKKHGAADLMIVDEAHHAAGSADKPTVKAIHGISAEKVVYMTATQKMVAERVLNRRSMDDRDHFGDTAYELTFGEAANQHIIAPSVLALLSVPDDDAASMFTRLGEDGFRIKGSGTNYFKYEVAAAIVTVRCLTDGGLRRILTFHNRKESAECFSKLLGAVAKMLGYDDLWFGSITENTAHRQRLMDKFATLDDGGVTGAVLSSCRVLAEGYDLPSVDGVVVVDPRMSSIDITQTINRGSRFDEKRPGKKNIVIIPVLGDNPHGTDSHGAAFSSVQRTIDMMRDIDGSITGMLYDMAAFQRPQSLDEPLRPTPSMITDLPVDVARTVSLKILDPGITSWMERFEQLQALGHIPSAGKGSPERSLGHWVVDQRTAHKRGILSDHRSKLLESLPRWWWTDDDGKWMSHYVALKSLGRMPPTESSLAHWANMQRNNYKNRTNRLNSQRVALLESLDFWSWNRREDQWELRLQELITLGRMPDRKIMKERPLSDWVKSQRRFYREENGNLSADQSARLAALPFWYWTNPGAKEMAVLASYSADKSIQEIANDSGVAAGTVRGILYRGDLPYARNHTRGSSHPGSVLTESDVRKIADERRAGHSLGHLAAMFGVAVGTIHSICNGTNWVHITGGPVVPKKEGETK